MPEVVRGSKSQDHVPLALSTHAQTTTSPTSPIIPPVARAASVPNVDLQLQSPQIAGRPSIGEQRHSSSWRRMRKESIRKAEADAYYDSRAATKTEYRRRATTLQEYYRHNPKLLPQLPFTWHHGRRRWRLGLLIFLMFVDACVLPIVLYYAMTFAGNVQGYITFAIITSIWGGPTYLEMLIRTWRLRAKERFYRPLGTTSRWCFDCTTYTLLIAIAAVTVLFIVGSAPHIVWLRVLCMPGPAILYSIGIVLGLLTLWNVRGWKAPFRISSTAKGEPVRPGVYYIIEDIVAVNAGAGRPFREALSARYEASPRFRKMVYNQSLFWSIPPIIVAIPLTIIAVIHPVPAEIAYGICWAVPFFWAFVWAAISTIWAKHALRLEREEWEASDGLALSDRKLEEEDEEAQAPMPTPTPALAPAPAVEP